LEHLSYLEYECVGKTEIDSLSGNRFLGAFNSEMVFWEKRTIDSVWIAFKFYFVTDLLPGKFKLNNYDYSLSSSMEYTYIEIISYTNRF